MAHALSARSLLPSRMPRIVNISIKDMKYKSGSDVGSLNALAQETLGRSTKKERKDSLAETKKRETPEFMTWHRRGKWTPSRDFL